MTKAKRITPRVKQAINWIAYNDNDAEKDLEAISEYISVALISDVFCVPELLLAEQILKLRKARDGEVV